MNNNNQTKLLCVNAVGTNLVARKNYYGRMFRVRNGSLSATSSYENATYFETKNANGKTVRFHKLRFVPA